MVEELKNIKDFTSLKKFFKEHKDVLEYLKKYEGLDNLLGSGNYGKVFKIKNQNAVLKITTDKQEIRKCLKLQGKTNKHLIDIYHVNVIKPNLAIIEAEMLYPLSPDKKREVLPNIQYMSWYFNDESGESSPFDGKDITMKTFVKETYIEVIANGLEPETIDIHMGNVLQTKDNKLKLIDI